MPSMLRVPGKAQKIAEAILGKPANAGKKKRRKSQLRPNDLMS